MRAYFGFMILMGLCPRPALSDYWRRDPFIGCPSISEWISRDRFLEIISWFLHFADNSILAPSGSSEYDRLGKVLGIMDKVSERFLTLYSPHCENSIEAMIPFQGHSSLKQYMPAKSKCGAVPTHTMVSSVSFKCILADAAVIRTALGRGWYWISLVNSRGGSTISVSTTTSALYPS